MATYKYDGQQWIDYNQYDTALEVVQKSKNNILYLESLHDSGAIEEELNRIRDQIITIESELSSLEMRTEGIEETLPLKQDELSAGLAIGLYGTTIAVKLQDIAAKLDSVPSGAAITESSADFIRVNNIMYYKTQTIVGGMTTYAYEELTNSDLTERIVAQIPTDFKIDESGRLVLVHDSNVIGMGVEIGGIGVTIDTPATATQGTLTATQLGILEASETNYIMFNHEKYYLMDKQHTSGSLTYSHVGADNQVNHIKTFTITLSNLTWVLIDTEIGKSEPAITIVDVLPEANEENFEKGKIYTQGDLLQYLAKIRSEGALSATFSLTVDGKNNCAAAIGTDIYIFGCEGSGSSIYKLDTTNNQIITLSVNLPAAKYNAAAASVGNNIYIFGGTTSTSSSAYGTSTIFKLNTTTNAVSTLSVNLPKALVYLNAVAIGNDVYIISGKSSNSSSATINNVVYKFDTTTEEFTEVANFSYSNDRTECISIGNDIYIFNAGSSKNSIYKFNVRSLVISSLGTATGFGYGGVANAGDNVYIFGGGSVSKDIYKYNIQTNTSTTYGTTTGVCYLSSAIYCNNSIYVIGCGNSEREIYQYSFGFTYQYKTITAE